MITKGITIFVVVWFCLSTEIRSQCLQSDSLWVRLEFQRTSTALPNEKLKELLDYEKVISSCSNRNDSSHAFLLFRIGATYYRMGNYLQAVEYARNSILMIYSNASKSSVNQKHLVGNYFYLSVMCDSLSMTTEKIRALDSCIAVAARYGVKDLFVLGAMYQRAEISYDVGDYHRCFAYASACEKLAWDYANSVSAQFESGLSYALNSDVWKVNVHLKLNEYDAAEKLLENRVEEYKKMGADIYMSTLFQLMADVQVSKGNLKSAEMYYQKALHSAQKYGYSISAKTILNNLGFVVYSEHYKNWEKAINIYRRALDIRNKDESQNRLDAIESLNIMANIANAFVRQKKYDSSFHYFQIAFDQIEKGSNEGKLLSSSLDDFISTKRIQYLVSLLIDKGDAYLDQYRETREINFVRNAVHVYKATDRMLKRIKVSQSETQSKLFWRSNTRRLYEHAIEACYQIGNIEDAFFFFEKSRAALLQDQLTDQRWLGEKDIAGQVQVRKKILQLERELKGIVSNSERATAIRSELLTNQLELDRIINSLKEKNPLFYQSFLDTLFVTLKEVQEKILKNYQALVEIFAGDSAVYSFVITQKETKISKIDKNQYDSLVNQFIVYVANRDLLNKNYDTFISIARQLYQIILPGNLLPAGRIIISPDGPYFPFEALVTSYSSGRPTYLLEDHAISYAYSARYLLNEFSTSTIRSFRNFLGVAPIQYPKTMQLAALPGSDRSLELIRDRFSYADKLVSSNASRFNFMNQFQTYKVIHLYTHASDTSEIDEPVIYFADSAMYLSDLIVGSKPATQLIVLSACETGLGKVYKGEGVLSFNRGFAALGIPASVANLWAVDNESTYRLIELFYYYLSKGIPADIALQKSKLDFINISSKEKTLPFFWAATVITGKVEKLELKKKYSWKTVSVASVFILLFFLIWLRKRTTLLRAS